MRINKFVAQSTGLSRRAADRAIAEGRVKLNQRAATLGDEVIESSDSVTLDNKPITPAVKTITIMLNKPSGYVCSRDGQGSQTIYELVPKEHHVLKPIGRLDKNSSGLILLTNDGDLANQLTHPRYGKTKVYQISLSTSLAPLHQQMINDIGVQLEDGRSQLTLQKLDEAGNDWQITMQEGRNRQIRRTFESLGYTVTKLHRTVFGPYRLDQMSPTQRYMIVED
ncbi:MAG: pseudouridine synthase [Patescibacteria group bacterium]